jgi:hypothetical protein
MFDPLAKIDVSTFGKLSELLQFFGVATLCAGILFWVYRRTSAKESDGLEFASTIFMLTISIGLLVSIIKQAPAISFGLFGAMSIVRFRAQIKRTQRMVFVFMAAALGVCCGAGEYMATVVGTLVLSGLSLGVFALSQSKPATARIAPISVVLRTWSIEYIPAVLDGGQRLRVLTIVDETTHEALAALPDTVFSCARVLQELDRLVEARGQPGAVVSDSWPEFGSKEVAAWTKAHTVDWRIASSSALEASTGSLQSFVKFVQNACLDVRGFNNLIEARVILETCRTAYNGQLTAARQWQPELGSVASTANRGNGDHAVSEFKKPAQMPAPSSPARILAAAE